MIFDDPIRTISVELPAGWAYAPFDSSLTDFVFTRWDHPEELIAIHIRPAAGGEELSDEKWIERIQSEVGEAHSLADMDSTNGRAVAADFKLSTGAMQRVAFIRGPRIEFVIEQRGGNPGVDAFWIPLERAVRTVTSAINLEAPEKCGAEEFNEAIEAANRHFEKKDFAKVVEGLQRTIDIGVSAWLYSLAPPINTPEIHAAIRVAQAMMHLSAFTGNPSLPRDAESILRRAQRTLEAAGSEAETSQALSQELSRALQNIVSELPEGASGDENGSSPVVALRERGFRFAQAAGNAFEAQDLENARILSGIAVEDLLSLVSTLRRFTEDEVPQEIAEQLSKQGITDPNTQRETMLKAREAVLFPPLNSSLQIQYCCALEAQNPEASEIADVMLSLAELIYATDPSDNAIKLNRVLALMSVAGSRDSGRALSTAGRLLDEASQMIGSLQEERAADSWIRFYDRQIIGIGRALDVRIAAAKDDRERLQTLRTRFEDVSGKFRERISAA